MSKKRRDQRIVIPVTVEELAEVDSQRNGLKRAEVGRRRLLKQAEVPVEEPQAPQLPSHEESVQILAEMAKLGRVSAAIALEKALRTLDGADEDSEAPTSVIDQLAQRRVSR